MSDPRLPQSLLAHPLFRVGLFTGAYLLVAIWAALGFGNTEFVIYIAVMTVLIACVVWIHRRVCLSPGLLWALSLWGALHMAGGLVSVPDHWPTDGGFRVLYSWWIIPRQVMAAGDSGGWLKYDQLVHAYGFGVATWLCWQGLCGAMAGRDGRWGGQARLQPTAGLMVLVAAAGMGLGALNEVVEFVATRVTVTNVGGYVNTGWDLVYNALGASLAATILYLIGSQRGH